MLRGFCVVVSLLAVMLLAGCPSPTPPSKPNMGGQGKTTTETTEGSSTASTETPAAPADDAEAVKQLEAGKHTLKRDDAGHVVEVRLQPLGDKQQTLEVLKLVAKLPSLARLYATGPDVTDEGLVELKPLKNLKLLNLDQASVGDEGMAHLVDLPLADIDLKLTNVQDAGVKHLSKIKSLKHLKLVKTKVTDDGMPALADLPNLETVDLQDVNTVGNKSLPIFAGLKKLRTLRVWGTTFEGEGIAPIGSMTNLRSLSMEKAVVNDQNVGLFKNLTNLEKLILTGTFVTDTGMQQLAGLTKLREIELRGAPVGTQGMSWISGMQELDKLDLSETPTASASLQPIGKLPKLKELNLWATLINDEGVAHLADLKGLTYLNLDNTRISDAALDTVAKFGDLEFLHIGSCGEITDAGVAKLHGLKKLKKIHLTFLQNVNPDAVDALKDAIPALKEDGAVVY
jgi:Leucine-rich repeat (LRR) protein